MKGLAEIPVKGTVTPPVSGIKEAIFFIGTKPADLETARAAGQSAEGKAADKSGTTWLAKLPIPKDKSGEIPVAVRFTSNTDLSTFDYKSYFAKEPPPPPPDESDAAKKKPVKPGGIAGKVVISDRPQPGLDVYLISLDPKLDAKGKADSLKSTKTKPPGGTYEFKELPPGPYQIFCKYSDGRQANKAVMVEAEKTTEQNLELLLP
jgi:hypothetical protein